MNLLTPVCELTVRRFAAPLIAAAALIAAMPSQATDAPPVAAAPPAAGVPSSEAMEAAKKVHKEFMELQGRLAEIQKRVLETHPGLKQQEQALIDLMMSKMTTSSGNPKDDLAAINKLEETLRNPETPASDRQKLMGEYQQKAMAFRKAQKEAMKDPEVQKAQKALTDASLAAMKEQDPQVEQLIKDMQDKQAEMQKILMPAGHGQ